MGFCGSCGNWVYSTDKTCPKCGKDPNKRLEEPESAVSETLQQEQEESDVSLESDDEEVEVDEASLENLDKVIMAAQDAERSFFLACSNCGSRSLSIIPSDVVAAASTLGTLEERYVCRSCGHEGVPLIFDDEETHRKFCESKRGGSQGDVGA
jgi:predicted  nucleic acid-binding Zn-ribbon protein